MDRLKSGNDDMRQTIHQWQPNMDALRAENERLRAMMADIPKAIRNAADDSPYARNRTPDFQRGLEDGYEAAAQVVEHMVLKEPRT